MILDPLKNDSFFGHHDVIDKLLHLSLTGRLPHALLLHGAKGIGKATLAFQFTKHLLSNNSSVKSEVEGHFYFDNACEAVKQIQNQTHSDFIVISDVCHINGESKKTKAVSVDEIRALSKFLQGTSLGGGKKIAIIDGAEAMNKNASNALLKTLEEPLGDSLIILLSHSIARLSSTIKSRCYAIKMRPVNLNDFISIIQNQPFYSMSSLNHCSQNELRDLYYMTKGNVSLASNFIIHDSVNIVELVRAFLMKRQVSICNQIIKFANLNKESLSLVFFAVIYCLAEAGKNFICNPASTLRYEMIEEKLERFFNAQKLIHSIDSLYLESNHVLFSILRP